MSELKPVTFDFILDQVKSYISRTAVPTAIWYQEVVNINDSVEAELKRNAGRGWKPKVYVPRPKDSELRFVMKLWLYQNTENRYCDSLEGEYFGFETIKDAEKFCLYWNLWI